MNLQDNATGFQHIGFPTNDLQETIAFYEKLGFSVALRTYNEEAGEAVAFLQLGNLMLEISGIDAGRSMGSSGNRCQGHRSRL